MNKQTNMRSIFIFPPGWCNSHPYMSIPCLMPYMKKEYGVQPLDLNIEHYKYIRSKFYIEKCFVEIQKRLKDSIKVKYEMLYDFLINNIEKANECMHSLESFRQLDNYTFLALYEKNRQYFREIANANNKDKRSCKTVSDLIRLAEDAEANEYLEFYENYFEQKELMNYDVVMVSLAGTQQILPAMTLCRFIKKRNPHIKIIVGGNPFTKIINRIDKKWVPMFEKMFDYIVTYEGEYVLPALLQCLYENGDVSKLFNIIYLCNNEIVYNPIDSVPVDIEKGEMPAFDGYNLEDYASPQRILPYYVTRGCYWKKCAFCDHDFGYADCFRMKEISKIIRDLTLYKEKYNVKYIHFVDEAIPAKILEKISLELIERRLDIKWFTCIKASKNFTPELCKIIKEAGCTFVSIGVESCSQEVLDHMNKGITLDDIDITLKNMKKAGIWAHCFMINNFEGETDRNRWETFCFVNKRKDYFTSIGMGDFTLSRNAKIFPKVQIECIEEVSDFSNDIVYTSRTATTKQEAEILHLYYNTINPTSDCMGKLIFEREHLAIFISEREGFVNGSWLQREYMTKVQYNNRFLLRKLVEDKLYVYSLFRRELYVLPRQFDEVIEIFDGDVEKLLQHPCMAVYNNKQDAIRFLLENLY